MWRALADWMLAFFGMARELQEHRTTIRELEHRVRDLEEALKLLAQEQRHAGELAISEREKLLLRIENALAQRTPALPAPHRKKRS